MKFSAVLVAGAATTAYAGLVERAQCNADNCLRLVRGTNVQNPPLASRSADCASFQRATVTPAAVYTTVTVATVTVAGSLPAKRQVTASPSVVPAYATDVCQSSAQYASACSCFGFPPTTTTVATPTSTVSATATVTLAYPNTSCSNPASCDANARCSSGSCSGFCQPDSTGAGRCRSPDDNPSCDDQAAHQCSTNTDCLPGGFCLSDCCDTPSCYYEADSAYCLNTAATSRLFKKAINIDALQAKYANVKGGLPIGLSAPQ